MIRLRDISMRYDTGEAAVHALRSVDLDIGKGEYIALLGPSGSGKSTLMHILGCLSTPTTGRYELDGQNTSDLSPNRLATVRNQKIGFVFQRFHLMPRSTALENVQLPLRFAKVPLAKQREQAKKLLQRVGLGDRTSHKPSELSGGQQQRTAIARALANHPPILLADEPTGNLDSKVGSEIIKLLEELHAEGRTVIMVTHDEQLAQRAQRTIRLLDGNIVEDSRR